MRGGEKCLEVFCELFPDATIFTLLHKKGSVSPLIEKMKIRTSFIQCLPRATENYRHYLPLFPLAVESFNLKGFDLVLSSSHSAAKGARAAAEARHICYCYTPMRYAWAFFEQYFGQMSFLKKQLVALVIRRLKKWDLKTNERIDFFIAISDNIKSRIKQFYGREAQVIYPPVDIARFPLSVKKEKFYLIVSALVPYKRIDLAIQAFNALGKKLVIIGTGDSEKQLRKLAKANIEFLGWLEDRVISEYYARCKALIFPGEEDFGIVPVEAQACGKPVIAYGKGGALETITPETGVFFSRQTPEALVQAVREFEIREAEFDPEVARKNALRFGRERFKKEVAAFIKEKIDA